MICQRCFKKFEDNQAHTPAEELGEIFQRSTKLRDVDQLCPKCKEELGIMNLLGFLIFPPK